eukprot:2489824-Rhodomonas_salina.1
MASEYAFSTALRSTPALPLSVPHPAKHQTLSQYRTRTAALRKTIYAIPVLHTGQHSPRTEAMERRLVGGYGM